MPRAQKAPPPPGLIGLREESNAEETFAILANVYSREKSLFSIRES